MASVSYSFQQYTTGAKHLTTGGGLTPAGAVGVVFALAPGGGLSPSGGVTLLKNANDIGVVGGGLIPVGNLNEIIIGLADGGLEGYLTLTGALTLSQTVQSADLSGTVFLQGDLNFQTSIRPAGGLTPVGTLKMPDAIKHGLGGGLTPTSALNGGAGPLLISSGTGRWHFKAILNTVIH